MDLKAELTLIRNSQFKRRKELLETMNSLESKKVDCHQCPGTCCTFISNSMQMTVVEAVDLYLYLTEENLWDGELEEKLQKCVKDFRLDVRPTTGGGQFLRKSYTCPFFGHTQFGCPLPREIKPYGCLGFNPSKENELEGKSCHSDNDLLLKRENSLAEEERLNHEWQQKLKLPWEKENIPLALLDLHKAFGNLGKK